MRPTHRPNQITVVVANGSASSRTKVLALDLAEAVYAAVGQI